jgi:hypothetical protein
MKSEMKYSQHAQGHSSFYCKHKWLAIKMAYNGSKWLKMAQDVDLCQHDKD